ncbi:ubiquinone/menaquinone biosynthesis C-methylase UbiE [Nocardiopsis mwathae]|uniref:Ubiquinone/menaquinone biosynthesis C-methylase UbiE n=1 Tax=Nocardiopsis mwathae TaxID=1472723 RepID=A0A7W9YI68_9ACTN|nr:class I SAM-dependent methyltransferase [Nocardiopsis mwathae]MBB6171641.1 ubiquinone/menaquinone biosynthesis C-methylase UbiE [Nocardiopsis mwathae]
MPETPHSSDERSALVSSMYGAQDLGSFSLFSGNFINYGYWSGDVLTGPGPITVEQRTRSQEEMYRVVVGRLGVGPDDVLLEVGCGIGVGTALVVREFGPAEVHGVDLSPDQLARAERTNAEVLREHPGRLSFHQGSALDLPWPDAAFTGVYSVEAAQHFGDLASFAREAHRVLRPGGRFALATFFSPDDQGPTRLAELIATVRDGIDVVHPIGSFTADLGAAGFTDVRAEPIGDHVWHGFDTWVSQTEYRDTWGRNWLPAYKEGWVDYYLVTATAANGAPTSR